MGRKRKNKRKRQQQIYSHNVRAGGAPAVMSTWKDKDPQYAPQKACGFKLNVPEKVFEKIMYWINKASPNEVSGFGSLDFDVETREFTVRDAILLKQEVSGGSAEIDDAAIAKAMYEMREEPNALKWHWHSHPTFGVFWSGTDENLIRQLGQQGWIVATVFNCKRESRTAFLTTVELMGKPHDIFVDNFPLEVRQVVDTETQRIYDAEFDAKVTTVWANRQKSYSSGHYTKDKEYNGPYIAPIRKAIPTPIYPSEYDDYGYATVDGEFIYNPIYDSSVKGRQQQFAMIDDMQDEEISFLRERDYGFANLMRAYVVEKAKTHHFNESGVEV